MRTLLIAICVTVSGCATTPDPIRDTADGPTISQVREAPEAFVGERVRWGGTIAAVENGPEDTRVYLVARELYPSGRPRSSDTSAGRFIAVLSGFHDPVILAAGRELTAVGLLQGAVNATVGEFEYLYPVVKAQAHRLWPRRAARSPYYPYPYYPYHFYDPWYPHPYYWPHRYR